MFGLAPALYATRATGQRALRGGRDTGQASHGRLRSALLVGQMASAVVLLIGAALFVRSVTALASVDLGFDPEDLVTLSVVLPIPRYPGTDQQGKFHQGTRLGAARPFSRMLAGPIVGWSSSARGRASTVTASPPPHR